MIIPAAFWQQNETDVSRKASATGNLSWPGLLKGHHAFKADNVKSVTSSSRWKKYFQEIFGFHLHMLRIFGIRLQIFC